MIFSKKHVFKIKYEMWLMSWDQFCVSASVFVIGSISGALVGGFSGEKLGRKKALLIDNIIMVLGKVVDTNQNIIIKLRQHIFCILYIFSTIVSNRLIFYNNCSLINIV